MSVFVDGTRSCASKRGPVKTGVVLVKDTVPVLPLWHCCEELTHQPVLCAPHKVPSTDIFLSPRCPSLSTSLCAIFLALASSLILCTSVLAWKEAISSHVHCACIAERSFLPIEDDDDEAEGSNVARTLRLARHTAAELATSCQSPEICSLVMGFRGNRCGNGGRSSP